MAATRTRKRADESGRKDGKAPVPDGHDVKEDEH
jgi:hypothetical protein